MHERRVRFGKLKERISTTSEIFYLRHTMSTQRLVAEFIVTIYFHIKICPLVGIRQPIYQRLLVPTCRQVPTLGPTVPGHNVRVEEVGDSKLQIMELFQCYHRHHDPITVDGKVVGDKAKPSQEFPQEWMEREPHPSFTYGHQRYGDMLGTVFSFVPYFVASHLANDVVGNVVFSAKVFVLTQLSTKEVGVGTNLTLLVEVGDLSVF